jgi:hypothetical protein
VDAGLDHRAIEIGQQIERFGVFPGDDLDDLLEGMLLVTGIDALRTVAELEIDPGLEARDGFDHRRADFLGRAGIDGRFEHDHRAGRITLPSVSQALRTGVKSGRRLSSTGVGT